MANPYKKAEQMQKKAPGARPADRIVEETPVVVEPPKKDEVVVATDVEVRKPEPEKEVPEISIKDSLLAGMKEQKPRGKSYGFYLDDEVVAALEKLAKQSKSNKSKVLNTLLRKILLENK